MIKCENYETMNFDNALRGMRNPLNSWDQSDSFFGCGGEPCTECDCYSGDCFYNYTIGENDLKLAQKLVLAGSDHRKFMRQMFVSVDITAPLFIWKEMDTYKVGTVANSCSTMHKLATTPITRECFSFDEELETLPNITQYIDDEGKTLTYSETVIRNCEYLRQEYLKTKDVRYWRALIQLLRESWNEMRTWTANYEVLRNIYFARRKHKLTEWLDFCSWIESLPYVKELICLDENKDA